VRKINWLYSLSKFWQYDPDASSDNKRLVWTWLQVVQ
jgi:hypothetical protein